MQRTTKFVVFLSVIGLFGNAPKVLAGCEVTPTNIYLSPGISTTFPVYVKNTSETDFAWVKIPVDNAAVISSIEPEIVDSGWVAMFGAYEDIFSEGRIAPGDTTRFNIRANTTSEEDNFDWIWETSIYSYGSPSEICNSINISTTNEPPMPTPTPIPLPIISEMAVSAGPSTATISWRSDVDATGSIEYGTTSEYGSSKTGDSGVQSHSISLTGLTPSTTYHFRITSGIESGSTITTDNTFVTAEAGATTTLTTTVTNTVTTTNTQTVSQTVVLADTVKPTLNIGTKFAKSYKEAPIVEGKVVDTGAVNAGIAKIEYSIDGGKNWMIVEDLDGARSSSFSFVPEIYDDGNFSLMVRAKDLTGNIGVSSKELIIIDRLPPRIIHSLWRVGPIRLSSPYPLVPGVTTSVAIQAIGGVTELSLLINEQEYKFNKNNENGLWEGEIVISEKGKVKSEKEELGSEKGKGKSEKEELVSENGKVKSEKEELGSEKGKVKSEKEELGSENVLVRAVDGGGNKIEERIGEISISVGQQTSGSVNQLVSVSVYRYDELTKRFKLWNGSIYGQNNPETNKFDWYLPEGRYYFKLSQKGYMSSSSEIFEIEKPSVVNVMGELQKWSLLNLFKREKLSISHVGSVISKNGESLIGKTNKWIEDSEYGGRELRLSVVASWDPGLSAILSTLGENDLVVVPGANQSSVDLLKSRGEYKPLIVADPDGLILGDLASVSLPITLELNRRAVVEGVK